MPHPDQTGIFRDRIREDGLATVLLWAIWTESLIGSSDMEGHVEELLALSTERGFSFHLAYATGSRGRCLMARGKRRKASRF